MTTLTDRARKLFATAHRLPESQAVEMITAMLRVTRQEGIAVGLDQAEKHSDELRRTA